ncbi:LGFP repeat-containing protein [Oerskovia sp. NPDC056781]|uniref:LGFP repeat-containing protein n=1 Tax=Oerskovia sp. NPDC056781 TaxID=3345942 RepID=UPI00366AE90C
MTGPGPRSGRARSLLAALTSLALVLTGALFSTAPASAVSGSDFNPGFIISDAVFYDSGAMSTSQIQSFIETKGARCTPAAGNTCLKSYRESTNTIPGDSYCAAYQGAPSETAAQIIAKVSVACKINPQVLLVTLQKEQGLVTSTAGKPAATFRRALGYGCPDNAGGWCDPSYSGFFIQMQRAARQFQLYKARPTSYSYVAGRTNTILYHPNTACGTTQVYIQNQATAALYNYTPYVPNAAALAAGYGTGNSCSSYGNRNFFLYFGDWFGSSGFVISPYIWNWYQVASNRAAAGDPTTAASVVAGGVRQGFQGGSVYMSGLFGVQMVPAGLLDLYYNTLGGPAGVLGFPTGSHSGPAGGLSQPFQNGTMFISGATGFTFVSGWMLDVYTSNGGPAGALGFPTSPGSVVAGGLTQSFQGGTVWISGSAGVHTLPPAVQTAYVAAGGPAGPLGFPTGRTTSDGVEVHLFQHGAIYGYGGGYHPVSGWMYDLYRANGGTKNPWGLPVGGQRVEAGGIVQTFERGTVYIAGSTGVQTVPTVIQTVYASTKGPAGPLGFPTGPATTANPVTYQPFQSGVLYTDGKSGGYVARGMMADVYASRGGYKGSLGLPTGNTSFVGGGIVQAFTSATVYVSGSGGIQSNPNGGLAEMYFRSLGGPTGTLGWPAGPERGVAGGIVQPYTKGTMYISGSTGFNYSSGWMGDVYRDRGGPAGSLGFPTSSPRVEAGAIVQSFQTGTIYIAGTTGIQTVPTVVQAAFVANGGPAGRLGFPVAAAVVSASGTSQRFQNGTITVSSAGAVTVTPG